MTRRLLLWVALSVLFITGCSITSTPVDGTETTRSPSVSSSRTPDAERTPSPEASSPEPTVESPSPAPSAPSLKELEELYPGLDLPEGFDIDDYVDEDGNFDVEKFLRWLKEQPGYGDGGNGEDCNPLSPTCLYDPFYGSCRWDAWRGLYICDGPHYRPGHECYYDAWLGYVCKPEDGNGW